MGDIPSTSVSRTLRFCRLSTGLSEGVVRSENFEPNPSTSKDLTRNFHAGPAAGAGLAPSDCSTAPFACRSCCQLMMPSASRPASRRPLLNAMRATVIAWALRSQVPPSTVSFSAANNGCCGWGLWMFIPLSSLAMSRSTMVFVSSPISKFACRWRSMPAIAALTGAFRLLSSRSKAIFLISMASACTLKGGSAAGGGGAAIFCSGPGAGGGRRSNRGWRFFLRMFFRR